MSDCVSGAPQLISVDSAADYLTTGKARKRKNTSSLPSSFLNSIVKHKNRHLKQLQSAGRDAPLIQSNEIHLADGTTAAASNRPNVVNFYESQSSSQRTLPKKRHLKKHSRKVSSVKSPASPSGTSTKSQMLKEKFEKIVVGGGRDGF